MIDFIDINIKNRKKELLDYYRSRSWELISEIMSKFPDSEYKKRASEINKGLNSVKESLINVLIQKAKREEWDNKDIIQGILILTYTGYLVMLESRNRMWQYEYMAFSRRMGELWEPLCQICWRYPMRENIAYFIPPLFKEVKEKLIREINNFIGNLNITDHQKDELRKYYNKVWSLVTSGEINLHTDLHFSDGEKKYVVDFKSGFGSNEKGNLNRLLLVGSVYKILEENYECLVFVRKTEANNYLQILKNSGLWNVYSGNEMYNKIEQFTGFDLLEWINKNVDWKGDFSSEMRQFLDKNKLMEYVEW